MDQVRFLALAFALFFLNGQAKNGANDSYDQRNCSFLLSNQRDAQEQFDSIDHRKIWLVYLKIQMINDSSQPGGNKPLVLAWTKSEDSPFLTFDSNFEIYSFSMLTEAVKLIKLKAKSVGPNSSSDCLKQSSLLCRNKTISKAILRTLTNKKGVVCFGESPSRRCCKYRHEDVKCGIIPEDRWRWLDGSACLAFLFGIVGMNFLSILVYLLPSLPALRNGIEVTSLLNPSPLSFSNLLNKCFNNKPVRCFRDAFIIFCCRITVLLGLLPLGLYLSTITFRTLNHRVCFVSEHPTFFFSRVNELEVAYIVFSVYAVAVSLFPILQYRYLFQTDNTETSLHFKYRFCVYLYCWLSNFGLSADFLKSYVEFFSAYFSFFLWYSLPFCCQDKRNIRRKPCNMPTWLNFVLSPFIFLFSLLFLSALLLYSSNFFVLYPIKAYASFFQNKLSFLVLPFIVAIAQLFVNYINSRTLSIFATYTTIGFVLSYKQYLSFLSGVLLVVSYVYQSYRNTNEEFDELRRILFEVCTEMQIEKQEQSQDEELQPVSASQHLQRQLIYIDEENGSLLIPKELYANICWELKPVGIALVVLAIKVCAVILFVVALLSVVLTLTPRSEFGNVAQAALTLLVGSLPKIFTVFSKNSSKENQQIMETKSRIRHYVKKYLEDGALSEEQFLEAKFKKSYKHHVSLKNRFTNHVSYIEANRPHENSPLITV